MRERGGGARRLLVYGRRAPHARNRPRRLGLRGDLRHHVRATAFEARGALHRRRARDHGGVREVAAGTRGLLRLKGKLLRDERQQVEPPAFLAASLIWDSNIRNLGMRPLLTRQPFAIGRNIGIIQP